MLPAIVLIYAHEIQNNVLCIYTHTYTPINKIKTVQYIHKVKLTQWTKETENYIYQLRTKLTKAQAGKQN